MKKITTLLLVFIVLISSMMILSSCSSAEDKILGRWEYEISSGNELYASSSYTFRKSGDTYTGTVYMGSSYNTGSYDFTYTVEGNTIVCILDNGNEMKLNYSLSGNTLTIDGTEYTKQ